MKSVKNTLQNPTTIDPQTVATVLDSSKYMAGQPRDYRLNCKEGAIYRAGVAIGKTATLHVLAYRIMKGKLFGREKLWVELFFVDDEGKVGSTTLNSHSAEEFQHFVGSLFYEEATLPECVISIDFEKKSGRDSDDEIYTYHIIKFSFVEKVHPAIAPIVAKFTKHRPLYRQATLVEVTEVKSANFHAKPTSEEKEVVAMNATPASVNTVADAPVAGTPVAS